MSVNRATGGLHLFEIILQIISRDRKVKGQVEHRIEFVERALTLAERDTALAGFRQGSVEQVLFSAIRSINLSSKDAKRDVHQLG